MTIACRVLENSTIVNKISKVPILINMRDADVKKVDL